jgi:hypothetical protein
MQKLQARSVELERALSASRAAEADAKAQCDTIQQASAKLASELKE